MFSRSSKTLLLSICALAALFQLPAMLTASLEPSATEMSCAQLAGSDEERLLLCQLYESSALLAQLGALVNDGIERLASTQGLTRAISGTNSIEGPRLEKRKHEYLRFGKRKHEFVRFGRK